MRDSFLKKAEKYIKKHKRWRFWHRVIGTAAAVVVFVTTYMLILPAITIEGKTICGYEDHTHTEECYTWKPLEQLLCVDQPNDVHLHTVDCYDEETGEQICPKADFILHTHSDACYNDEGTLICTFREEKGHKHEAKCYNDQNELICNQFESYEKHEHTKKCYQEDVLICGKLEVEEHIHDESCIPEKQKLLSCKLEEHKHTEDCYEKEEKSFAAKVKSAVSQISTMAETGTDATNFESYVTGVSGTGTSYDKETGKYNTRVAINFQIPRADAIAAGYEYYYDLPDGVEISDALIGTRYDGYDSENKVGFQYEFVKVPQADGTNRYQVLVHFKEDYVQNAGEKMTGFIDFNGTLDKTTVKEDGSIQIPFTTEHTMNIPSEEIKYPAGESLNYDLDLSKSGSQITGEDKLRYTVTLTTQKGTPDPISFEDVVTANGLILSNATVASVTDAAGNQVSYTGGFDQNNKLSMSLPGLSAGGTYTIVYEYNIENLSEGNSKRVDNRAIATAEDATKGETVSDEAQKTVAPSKNSLGKTGWYDANNQSILWTITVNNSQYDIAGAILSDTMFDQIQEGTLEIKPNVGTEIQADGSIKFLPLENGKNQNKYVITYRTDASDMALGTTAVLNGASFDPDPGVDGDEIGKGVNVNINAGKIEKSFVQKEIDPSVPDAHKVSWDLKITVPEGGIEAGTELVDTLGDSWETSYNNVKQWMGKAECEALHAQIQDAMWTMGASVQFQLYDGTWKPSNAVTETDKVRTFKITFNNPVTAAGEYHFTYQSYADLEGVGSGKNYKNTAQLDKLTTEATYPYKKTVMKMDANNREGSTATTSPDGTVVWKVKVVLDSDTKKLTVIDTLPDGVELLELSYGKYPDVNLHQNVLIAEDGTLSRDTNMGEGASYMAQFVELGEGSIYNKETNSVTLNLQALEVSNLGLFMGAGNEFYVFYRCKIKGELPAVGESTKYNLSNSVIVKKDDVDYGSADQTQDVTVAIPEEVVDHITKSGKWNNATKSMSYSIDINPLSEDLFGASDMLTLEDKISLDRGAGYVKYLSLLQESVKVYEAQLDEAGVPMKDENGRLIKGQELQTGWNWHYEEKIQAWEQMCDYIIRLEIPDQKALIFEYDYRLNWDREFKEDWERIIMISNTATLNGDKKESDSHWSNNDDKWEESATSGGITTEKFFILNKVDAANYKNALSNAEFTLYKYTSDRGFVPTEQVYVTNEKGQFRIGWNKEYAYDYNTAYCVVETKAPSGYELDAEPTKYYFHFSHENTEAYPEQYPTYWSTTDKTDLSKNSKTVYHENTRPTTQVSVEKQWQGKDGTPLSDPPSQVTMNLKRYAYDKATWDQVSASAVIDKSVYVDPSYLESHTITEGGTDWSYTWTDLPLLGRNEAGDTLYYEYYVEETPVTGFNEISNTKESTADGDRFIIVNQQTDQPAISLPHTGGSGTLRYTIMGLVLMVGSMLLYRKRNFRKV